MAILRRPMFRSGGKVDSRGTGITSGLDSPRQNYKDGDIVETYKEKLARLRADRPALSLGDYLQIAATGAEIAGAPSRGGGISGALTTAAGPLANLGRGLAGSMGARSAGERELAGQLTGLEIERQLKEKGLDSKSYADTNKINLIRSSIKRISEYKKALETANEAEKAVIKQQIKDEERILETLYGRDQTLTAIIKAAPELVQDFIENFTEKEGRAPTISEIKEYLKSSQGYAEGGVVEQDQPMMDPMQEQSMADPMQEQPENEKAVQLSYDELRARLPQEITDDIVTLLATSYEALADFAQIQTQADVNAFNSKYQVNLVLPQEA